MSNTRRSKTLLKTCALAVAALSAAGCPRQPTVLYVRVRSDFPAGEVRSIRADARWNRVMDGGIGQQDGGPPEFTLTEGSGAVVRRFPGTIVVAPVLVHDNVPVDITLQVVPTVGASAAFDVKARVRFARERTSVIDMFVPSLCGDPAVRDRCILRTMTEGIEYTCAGEGDDPCVALTEQTASEYRPDAGPAPVDVRTRDASTDASDAGLVIGHPSPATPAPNAVFSGVPTEFRVRVGADCGGADAVRVRFCSTMSSANSECAAGDPLASVTGSTAIASCADATVTVSAPLTLASPRSVYWSAEYLRGGVVVGSRSPWRRLHVRRVSVARAAMLTMRADLDDDGVADLVSSAPEAGQLFYLLGSQIQTSLPVAWPPIEAVSIGGEMVPPATRTYFARAIAYAGNAEGNDDIDVLVGDPGANAGRGWVHRYRWSAAGPRFNSSDALIGAAADASFGAAIAVGDFNDDGYPDALVGAPGTNMNTGAVYYYVGNNSGFTAGGSPRTTIVGAEPMALTGTSIAAGCDIDGDGVADAVIASPGALGGAGAVDVYFGNRGMRLDASSTLRLRAADGSLDGFGTNVACDGDFNADGYADVAVATRGQTSRGVVYVFRGGPTARAGMAMITGTLLTMMPGDRPGLSMAFARVSDVESSGDVLVIGEPQTSFGSAGYVKLLSNADQANPRVITASPEVFSTQFGSAVQVLGDLDGMGGDGRDEIAVGQPLMLSGFGNVDVLHFSGFPLSLTVTRRALLPAGLVNGQFGASMIR